MDISFTGFKNAGLQNIRLTNNTGEIGRSVIFNCELTNSFNGADLNEFQDILKKSPHPANRNFLNVQVIELKDGADEFYKSSTFRINGDEYDINMDNLWIFGKIGRFLRRVCETPDEKFKVNRYYIEGDDVLRSFLYLDKSIDPQILRSMHSPQIVKEYTQSILDNITNAVDFYLS